MSMNKYTETLKKAKPFVQKLTGKSADKALTDLARNLTGACYESNTCIDDFMAAYERDEIFDPLCLLGSYDNIYDYVEPKYRPLAKVLFDLRPTGLGTPNAAVGEGEFMCLALSPRVGIAKKKNTGDITVDDMPIEMKGEQVRIMGNITGVDLQKRAKSLAPEYGLIPNDCQGNREAYEPWSKNKNKVEHWINEFDRIGKENAVDFLAELFDVPKARFTNCWTNKTFDVIKLNKELLKIFFRQQERLWEAFTIIESDGRITSFGSDANEFDQLVDDDKIIVNGDYMRSFQNIKIGLYCQHV